MRSQILLWCQKYCNNPELEDKDDFAYVLSQMEEIMDRVGVRSQSLSDLSETFGDEGISVRNLLSPYKRVKML